MLFFFIKWPYGAMLDGLMRSLLIASSLVLISFLSFQIYQHFHIPLAYIEAKTIVRGY